VNRDLVFGAAGVVIAIGYYSLAAAIPESALADAVGPHGVPMVYATLLLFLSVVLVARSLRSRIPDPGSPSPESGVRAARVAGMLAFGAVYILLVPWLGYTIALAGLLFAVTWYLGGTISRSVAVVAVSGAIVFWLLFVRLLGIPHPAGVWTQLF
jgi:putative tricarboxylic transport membrane protein